MGQFVRRDSALVAQEKYVIGEHASERLEERGIMVGLASGTLMAERPRATPNPAIEVRQPLRDGTEFKTVWSHRFKLRSTW
jgi:hypothetical protein